jgi:acetyl-CoA synthetase
VNKLAKALKDSGVKRGDRVAVSSPVIPELLITLLATARIGGVHTVVFSGFSAEALADRVNDCGANPCYSRWALSEEANQLNQR